MLRHCGLVAIGCSICLLPLPPHTARRNPRRHKYKGAFYSLKSNILPGASCHSHLLLLLQYIPSSFINSYTSPRNCLLTPSLNTVAKDSAGEETTRATIPPKAQHRPLLPSIKPPCRIRPRFPAVCPWRLKRTTLRDQNTSSRRSMPR